MDRGAPTRTYLPIDPIDRNDLGCTAPAADPPLNAAAERLYRAKEASSIQQRG